MSASIPAAAPTPVTLRTKHRRLLVDLAVIAAIAFGAHAYRTRDSVKGAAPTLEGTGIDGSSLSLAALKGKPVLVTFWATWCGVCHQEAPSVSAIAKDHPTLSVAVQSGSADSVGAYVAQHDLHWPVIADPEAQLAAKWGVSAFPSSFILDGNGTIRFVEVGYTTELGLRARLWLAGLLS